MNLADMNGAIISPCEKYRYRLWRYWYPENPPMCFVMLNPSTADASENDQTIDACIRIATRNGAGGIEVVNLFAWRSTDPKALRYASEKATVDIVGADNDASILAAVGTTRDRDGYVVCAWGANASRFLDREMTVHDLLFVNYFESAHCLGVTKDGHPKHPLYLPNATQLQEFAL